MVEQRTGNHSAGKRTGDHDGWEFSSEDVFLSNPRKEPSVTCCSCSSITFSSLLIQW